MRRTSNYQNTGPVQNVNDNAIRCYEDGSRPDTETADVKAGSKIGFKIYYSITHPGPMMAYMAKVPSGESAATWDGSGEAWFKIDGMEPTVSESGLSWPAEGTYIHTYIHTCCSALHRPCMYIQADFLQLGLSTYEVTLPSSLPDGEYLIRVEHIALHSAGGQGGAQFYLACGQLNVSGGGNGTPSPLVSFPGAYSPDDPGILINLDWPIPTSYEMPGPPVWEG